MVGQQIPVGGIDNARAATARPAVLIADANMRDRRPHAVDSVGYPSRIRVQLFPVINCKIEWHDRERWDVADVWQVAGASTLDWRAVPADLVGGRYSRIILAVPRPLRECGWRAR